MFFTKQKICQNWSCVDAIICRANKSSLLLSFNKCSWGESNSKS